MYKMISFELLNKDILPFSNGRVDFYSFLSPKTMSRGFLSLWVCEEQTIKKKLDTISRRCT